MSNVTLKKLTSLILMPIVLVAIGVCLSVFTYEKRLSDTRLGTLKQEFEKRYEHYLPEQRAIIKDHVDAALSNLPENASEYEIAATLNAYIYRTLQRRPNATGGGVVVLTTGGAICGGMVATLAEMLYSIDIRSRYAFTVGGSVAHSMVEVYFSDGQRGLFDPYHGIAYFDLNTSQPVSITDIDKYLIKDKLPILYAKKNTQNDISSGLFSGLYSEKPDNKRADYSFFNIFEGSDNKGIANSGFTTTIRVDLSPGTVIGSANWVETDTEPKPWTRISRWQRSPGEYLSWAYQLGQISLGYLVEHAYVLNDLKPGYRYTLRLLIANAYTAVNSLVDKPAITLQPISPYSDPKYIYLESRGYSNKNYQPQVVEMSFEAQREEVVVIGQGVGQFILQNISLHSASM